MAYVPQFIPTNTAALQGVLDQYQKAYDIETARGQQMQEGMAAIPTYTTYTTAKKNELYNSFGKVIDELDKKYNYDRANSEYSKELARNITQYKGHPLWSLVDKLKTTDELRTRAMIEKGSDYYENVNPLTATLEDMSALNNWKVSDLKDLERQVATVSKEYATSISDKQPTIRPIGYGLIEIAQQEGFKNADEAMAWLNDPSKGGVWLKKNIASTGFNPDDPKVYNRAYSSAMSQLVGERKSQYERDASLLGRSGSGSTNTPNPWIKINNYQTPFAYETKSMSSAQNISKEKAKIDSELKSGTLSEAEKTAKTARLNQLQLEEDRYNALKNKVISENQGIYQAGHDLINNELKQYKTFIAGDKSQEIFDTLEEYFINTNAAQRTSLLTPFSDTDKLLMYPKVAEILKSYKAPNSKASDATLSSIAKDVVNKFADYYKGKGEFTKGYNVIEDEINKQLSSGEPFVEDVYTPPFDISSADYKKVTDSMIRNLPAFNVYSTGRKGDKLLSDNQARELQSKFLDKPEGTTVQVSFSREFDPTIILTNSSNEKFKLKMNLDKMGIDVVDQLEAITGQSKFKDAFFHDIHMAPTSYSLNDKDGYLKNIIDKLGNKGLFVNPVTGKNDYSAFEGLRISKTPDEQYIIEHPMFGSEKLVAKDKLLMISDLQEIFNEWFLKKYNG